MKALLTFFLLLPFLSIGQDNKIHVLNIRVDQYPDSVLTLALEEVNKTTDPSTLNSYYTIIAKANYKLRNWEASLSFLDSIDSLNALYELNSESKLECILLRSQNLYSLGKLIQANEVLNIAEPLFDEAENGNTKAKYLLHKGWLTREQGKHGAALEMYLEAKVIIEEVENDALLAECYSKIAVVYHVIHDYETAKTFYDKTLKLYRDLKMNQAEAKLYNNYGLLYQDEGAPSEAIACFEKSIELCNEYNDPRGVAIANENLGLLCFEELQNNSMALIRFRESLAIWEASNDIYGQAQTLLYVMYVYNSLGNYKKSIETGKEALNYAIQAGAKDVESDLYKEISISYEGNNQTSDAFSYYKKYVYLKDSLKALNEFDEIKSMSLRHDLEKENLQDSLTMVMQYEKEAVTASSAIKQQRFWTGVLSFGFLGSTIILFLLFRGSKHRKKSAALIEEANKKLKSKNKEIIDSINYAKRIQSAVLPSKEQITANFNECSILYLPKDIIAGDFYWLSETVTEENKKLVFFAVADCTGHGVPGAMVSIVCSTALNKAVNELRLTDPGEILRKATEFVIESFDRGNVDLTDGMDISLIAIEENDDKSLTVQFSGANNPLWFIRKSTGEIEEEKGTKRPVGKYNSPHDFETKTFNFVPGDLLYLFSDGFADQFGGPKHKKFKYKTLSQLFVDVQLLKPLKQTEKMMSTLKDWQGNNEQIDDVCIAVIRL